MTYVNKEFRPYDTNYFVSKDGEIFSTYKQGLLKQAIDTDGYPRVDIHGRHMKVHKLVYLVWNGPIPAGMQVNHKDDDKLNPHADNLYLGTQQENIADCFHNGRRVGHIQTVIVLEKATGKRLQFPSVKEFLAYTGHSAVNGSLARCKTRKWFQERFVIIEQKGVSTIESYKSIRTACSSRVENKAE